MGNIHLRPVAMEYVYILIKSIDQIPYMGFGRVNPNQENPKTILIHRDYWVAMGCCKHILAEIKLSNISNNILILFSNIFKYLKYRNYS